MLLGEVAEQRTDPGADGGRGEQRRGEQPDHQTDAAAHHRAGADGAVALLEHVDLAVGVAAHHDCGFDLEVGALRRFEALEVLLRRRGIRVSGDVQHEVQFI